MKRIKQVMSLLLAAPLVCAVLAGSALAANENALWAQLKQSSGAVAAVMETNAAVTDGAIQVTFDPNKLTYVSCDFEGAQEQYKPHVAMHAVNDSKAGDGVVRISWVASDANAVQGGTEALFQVNFKAKADAVAAGDLSISGTASTWDGKAVTVVKDSATQPQPTQPPVEPSAAPTTQPTAQPTVQPTTQPTAQPTGEPTAPSTASPSQQPAQPNGGDDGQTPATGSEQKQPSTGDHASLILYLGLAVACAAGLGLAVVARNKRRDAE